MLRKILIVEDDTSLQKVLMTKFKKENFSVLIAHDGVEGLELAKKDIPDIILLDIIMPKMDGLTMLSLLRREEWGKNIPVIMLSNLSDSAKVSQATKDGVCDFLIKSDWHLDDVVMKVRERLGDK
jgi:DNA-binding response OmpR family regulator